MLSWTTHTRSRNACSESASVSSATRGSRGRSVEEAGQGVGGLDEQRGGDHGVFTSRRDGSTEKRRR